MNAPRITVLMPAHNAARTIADAARSVLAQTWSDFELLVVDDASTDETTTILESLADPRLRVRRAAERLKLAGALNLGMREARGEFIARMDADDISHPTRLAKQLAFLEQHPDVGLCGTAIRTFGDGSSERLDYPRMPEQVRAFALFNCPFAHPTVMFRKTVFLKHSLFYDVSYYPTEDYELWERVLRIVRGANLPDVCLRYRRHAASMTGSDWPEMDRQAARIQARMLDRLGLPCDEPSASRHRAWAAGRIEPSIDALREAESWLRRIVETNRDARLFDPSALADVVSERWFTLAMRCAPAGESIRKCFAASPLSGRGIRRIRRIATLAASIVRRSRGATA